MDHINQQILSWNKATKLNNKNNNNVVISIISWFIVCKYYQFILTYILPLIPLLYYCYTTKKAHHLDLFDTIQYKITHYLKSFRTWYIGQYPPHLFLIGLYSYFGWITLHQLLSTKWIITLLGYFIYSLSVSTWYLKLYQHKDIQTLKQFLFPPLLISSEHLIQRALHYQQQFMIQTLDHELSSNSTSEPFMFVIYENQRQLPFVHTWHPFTFPFERKQWTDEFQHTVLSKDQFVLPSPVQSQDYHGKKVWNWVWIDSDWKKNNDNDWIYSNLFWVPSFSSKNNSSSSLLDIIFKTRKRQWSRKAVLEYTSSDTTTMTLSNELSSSADSIKSETSTISNISSVINTTTFINSNNHSNTKYQPHQQHQQEQHKNINTNKSSDTIISNNSNSNNNNNNNNNKRTIKNIKITLPQTSSSSSSLVSPTSPTSLFMSPTTSSSAKPGHSSVSLVDHRYQLNDSQTSLFSTKTTSSINHPTSPISPKKSTSKSNRRQAVWKSIIKTS